MQVILNAKLRPDYEAIVSGIKEFEKKWETIRENEEELETLSEELSKLPHSELKGATAALTLRERHPHLYYTDPIEIDEKIDNNGVKNHVLIKVPPQREKPIGMCTIQIYHTGTINITYYDPVGEDICYYFLELLCDEYRYKKHNPHHISLVEIEACKSPLKVAFFSRSLKMNYVSTAKAQIPADLETDLKVLKRKLEKSYREHR